MRVSTAFNKILSLPGTLVTTVEFTDTGLVLGVRRRSTVHRCPCGRRVRGRHDARRRRWRHLDFGATRVELEAVVVRIWCPRCQRVRTEDVPWARPAARFTRDFEDVIGWLAQRMDKTSVARLLRTSWKSVDRAIQRVVADHLNQERLEGLYRLGVDEVSYKKGHHYLSVVADHDTGHVVWVAKGRSEASLSGFFEALGPQRMAKVEAVTMDGGKAFIGAVGKALPNARICLDPFHVIQWATQAVDAVFRAQRMPFLTAQLNEAKNRKPWDRARAALRRGRENLTSEHLAVLKNIRRERRELYRAWNLKEELRDLYRLIDPAHAADYLRRWIRRARRSKIPAFTRLADRLEGHFERIIAAVELDLSNSRLEGINAKIRVIQRRGYGHHDPASLAASIYLCCAGIRVTLPTQR